MSADLNRRIGKKVHELRRERGLTTWDLARKVGISQAQISRLETGKQGFRTSTLDRISQALGTTPSHFFEDEQDKAIGKALEDPKFRAVVKKAADSFLSGTDAVLAVPVSSR